jgi:hypothetical protein
VEQTDIDQPDHECKEEYRRQWVRTHEQPKTHQ